MEILSIISLTIGIIGLYAGYYYYRKNQRNSKIIQSWIDANYRIEDDRRKIGKRRGEIIKNKDGTFSIRWYVGSEPP